MRAPRLRLMKPQCENLLVLSKKGKVLVLSALGVNFRKAVVLCFALEATEGI